MLIFLLQATQLLNVEKFAEATISNVLTGASDNPFWLTAEALIMSSPDYQSIILWLLWIHTNPLKHNNTSRLTDRGSGKPATSMFCLPLLLLKESGGFGESIEEYQFSNGKGCLSERWGGQNIQKIVNTAQVMQIYFNCLTRFAVESVDSRTLLSVGHCLKLGVCWSPSTAGDKLTL